MLKDKTLHYLRLRYFVAEFGDDIFSIDTNVLFCKLWECKVNNDKKCNIMQYIKTEKHIKAIKRG